MIICDAHADTLSAISVSRSQSPDITFAKAKEGRLSLQIFALWSGPDPSSKEAVEGRMALQYEGCRALEQEGWQLLTCLDDPICAPSYMLSIEGGEIFNDSVEEVDKWYQKGVRMSGITWNFENNLGTCAKVDQKKGLTPHGLCVVKRMQQLGIAVDTSHLSERGFYDIFLSTNVPPLASHSCCAHIQPHFRNLTDEQLRLLISQGGYVGINFYPPFLTRGTATIDTVIDHIDHVCQLGGENHVGFGSDFDGIDDYPNNLTSPAGFPLLLNRLAERGYSQTTIENIAGQNFISYFTRIQNQK